MPGSHGSQLDRLAHLGDRVRSYPCADDLVGGLDPARTAIVGIHWQRSLEAGRSGLSRAFLAADQDGLVDRFTGLLDEARRVGVLVAFANVCNDGQGTAVSPLTWLGTTPCGTPEAEVIARLGPHPGDRVLHHHRVSAFAGTDLAVQLAERDVDTLLVAGSATNMGVESTARDASDRGYRVAIVEDCCVAGSDTGHEQALDNLAFLVTALVPSDTLVERMRGLPTVT